ncbi:MAG: response regulator [Polyangiaceae bacterium]
MNDIANKHRVRSRLGHLLVVEDDVKVARSWCRLLALDGWGLTRAATVAQAEDALDEHTFDAVLLDVRLGDESGLTLLPLLTEMCPRPRIVVITGSADAELAVELMDQVDAVVPKPVPTFLVRKLVGKATRDLSEEQLGDFCRIHALSPNERRLLEIASRGGDKATAAHVLGCKPSAIGTYWKRISKKTSCHGQRDIFVKLWRHSQTLR